MNILKNSFITKKITMVCCGSLLLSCWQAQAGQRSRKPDNLVIAAATGITLLALGATGSLIKRFFFSQPSTPLLPPPPQPNTLDTSSQPQQQAEGVQSTAASSQSVEGMVQATETTTIAPSSPYKNPLLQALQDGVGEYQLDQGCNPDNQQEHETDPQKAALAQAAKERRASGKITRRRSSTSLTKDGQSAGQSL